METIAERAEAILDKIAQNRLNSSQSEHVAEAARTEQRPSDQGILQ